MYRIPLILEDVPWPDSPTKTQHFLSSLPFVLPFAKGDHFTRHTINDTQIADKSAARRPVTAASEQKTSPLSRYEREISRRIPKLEHVRQNETHVQHDDDDDDDVDDAQTNVRGPQLNAELRDDQRQGGAALKCICFHELAREMQKQSDLCGIIWYIVFSDCTLPLHLSC